MKIVFTTGDCNGIGLEVLAKGLLKLEEKRFNKQIDFTIIGNKKTIVEYYEKIKFPYQINGNSLHIGNKQLIIIDNEYYSPVEFGKETIAAGKLAAHSIEKAISMVLTNEFNAMVTLPISKAVIHKAGWKFTGHTEMLAARCNVSKPLMLLCSNKIRVGLLTIHVPLLEVPKLITKKIIQEISIIFHNSLIKDFAINKPKIALLGLNPHAGENGDIGKEEQEIIIPAINNIKTDYNINLSGPFPADGFFAHKDYLNYDGILAMYHDQGLIPLKLLANGTGVNFTANLPIVRTSPDHGTAYQIAGKNLADGNSVAEAIIMAFKIAENRNLIKH